MSGHSKWSTIKRKKGAADAKRGKIFSRMAKEIQVAAKDGGADPESNSRLRLAIANAKGVNMPKENIERAVARGTGEDKDGAVIEQIMYEGYAPHGVALMIDVVTDNRNRTVADLRHVLTRSGGNMADAGAVSWQFRRMAYFYLSSADLNSDEIFELAVDAGADDVMIGDEEIEIIAPVDAFKKVSDALESGGIKPDDAGLRYVPNSEIQLPSEESLRVMRIIEELEDLEDVQHVYSNLDVTEEAVALLELA